MTTDALAADSQQRTGSRAVLVESHAYFRKLGAWLQQQVEKVGSEVSGTARKRRILARIGGTYADLLWGLRSHQRYEEQRLFPFLEACYPSLSFDKLEEDHRSLQQLATRVEASFAAARRAETAAAVEVVRLQTRAALQSYLDALAAHFEAEQARVLPLVDGLSEEDFAALRASTRASCAWPNPAADSCAGS